MQTHRKSASDLVRRVQAQVGGWAVGSTWPPEPVSREQDSQASHLHFTMHTLQVGSLLASHYELAIFPRLGSLPGSPLAWDAGGWWEKGLTTHSSPGSYSGAHPKEAIQVTAGPIVLRLGLCPFLAGQRPEGVIPASSPTSDSQGCFPMP